MSYKTRTFLISLFSLLIIFSQPLAAAEQRSLFINLTSNDINRAAMAVNFGQRVLQQKKIPVTLFLNVDAVHLLNKNIPQHQHAKGKTIHQMLQAFMKHGGKVIVCPMCLKHVGGMDKDDLINGVLMGGPDTTWAALFADNVTVLSY